MATILVERVLPKASAMIAEGNVTSPEPTAKSARVHSLTKSPGMPHAAEMRASAKAHMPAAEATAKAAVASATTACVGRADGQG